MSSSNCCFLTCIQISQEAGQVVWYSTPRILQKTQVLKTTCKRACTAAAFPMSRDESKQSTQWGRDEWFKEWGSGLWRNMAHTLKKEIMSSEVQISDNQNQWRREDESCVIGFTFQTGQTRLLAVSTLTKIKWTPSDGNFLCLAKGIGERKSYIGRLKFTDSHKYLSTI